MSGNKTREQQIEYLVARIMKMPPKEQELWLMILGLPEEEQDKLFHAPLKEQEQIIQKYRAQIYA